MSKSAKSSRTARLIVALYAALLIVASLVVAEPAPFTSDGNTYLEMVRAMADRGSFAVENGLDVIDSAELRLEHHVRIGPRLVPKYPPFYALIAAPFYALNGISGLILVNAISLAGMLLVFHEMARRVTGARLAFAATLALPVVTPLFSYTLLIDPHVLSAALVAFAIALAVRTLDPAVRRPAFSAALAGALLGIATGVRLQNVFIAAVVGWELARRGPLRARRLLGFGSAFGSCLLALASINLARFGTPNPFSYGPPGVAGAPVKVEQLSSLILSRGYLPFAGLAVAWLAVRFWARRRDRGQSVSAAAFVIVVLTVLIVPALRATLLATVFSLYTLLIDAVPFSGQVVWHGWLRKSLLQCSPILVLGLIGSARHLTSSVVELRLLARVVLVVCAFLATRNAYSVGGGGVLGGLTFSPRYLAECLPAFVLLATLELECISVRRDPNPAPLLLRLATSSASWLAVGALAGSLLGAVALSIHPSWPGYPLVSVPLARMIPLTLPLALALGLAVALAPKLRERRAMPALGSLLVGSSLILAIAFCAADTLAIRRVTRLHADWSARVSEALPPRVVIVGWGPALHGIFSVRERRRATLIDASVDSARGLGRVLDAFAQSGEVIAYFGVGSERARAALQGRFVFVPLLKDPMLWWVLDVRDLTHD